MHSFQHPIDEIFVPEGRRPIDESTVASLVESIKRIGLKTPITVRADDAIFYPEFGETDAGYWVVAGAHRLEACRRLGWKDIDVVEINDSLEAQMWEISENLHRAELTTLERDQQIARWIDLGARVQLRQPAANESKRTDKRGHRQEGGVRAAARELGISERDARRAVKVSGLSDEAKQAARELGLDDNRTALLRAAREDDPKEQINVIQGYAAEEETADQWLQAMFKIWNRGQSEWREVFLNKIGVT